MDYFSDDSDGGHNDENNESDDFSSGDEMENEFGYLHSKKQKRKHQNKQFSKSKNSKTVFVASSASSASSASHSLNKKSNDDKLISSHFAETFVDTEENNNNNDDDDDDEDDDEDDDIDEDDNEVLNSFEEEIKKASLSNSNTNTKFSNNYFRDLLLSSDLTNGQNEMNVKDDEMSKINEIKDVDADEEREHKKPDLPDVDLSNLGKWEKHTKGFGMKFLQKFGFNGRLGARETGVSKALEAVVRPSGIGLGFNENKDSQATAAIQNNKEIEMEWRGINPNTVKLENESKSGGDNNGSIISKEMELLASQYGWKKDFKNKKSRKNNNKNSIDELINLSQSPYISSSTGVKTMSSIEKGERNVIIDMRGEETKILNKLSDLQDFEKMKERKENKLGEFLLSEIGEMSERAERELREKECQLFGMNEINRSNNHWLFGESNSDSRKRKNGVENEIQNDNYYENDDDDEVTSDKDREENEEFIPFRPTQNKIIEKKKVKKGAFNPSFSSSLSGVVGRLSSVREQLREVNENTKQQERKASRLKQLLDILGKVEQTHSSVSVESNEGVQIDVEDVMKLMRRLFDMFEEEFVVFGVVNILPGLLLPVLKVKSSVWTPLNDIHWLIHLNHCFNSTIQYFIDHDKNKMSKPIDVDNDVDVDDNSNENVVIDKRSGKQIAQHIQEHFKRVCDEVLLPPLRRCIISFFAFCGSEVCDDVNATQRKSDQNEEELMEDITRLVQLVSCAKQLLTFESYSQLIDMVLLPQLQKCVDLWQPIKQYSGLLKIKSKYSDFSKESEDVKDDFYGVNFSLNLEILLLPWLNLLETKLSQLFPEIRRKLHRFFLHQWNPSFSSVSSSIACARELINPWVGIFDPSSLSALVTTAALPRLAQYLRKVEVSPQAQETEVLSQLIAWHTIIPPLHFSALFLGEFFPNWLRVLSLWLCSETVDLEEVALWYEGWRDFLFPLFSFSTFSQHSQKKNKNYDFEKDVFGLGKAFNAALCMMAVMLEENGEIYKRVRDLQRSDKSKKEKKEKETAEEFLLSSAGYSRIDEISYKSILEAYLQEVRIKDRLKEFTHSADNKNNEKSNNLSGRNVTGGTMSVSFKEVVEKFAEKNGIEYYLKTQASNTLPIDAKGMQLYQFGKCVCYIDQDVMFVRQGFQWSPIDLDSLLTLAR